MKKKLTLSVRDMRKYKQYQVEIERLEAIGTMDLKQFAKQRARKMYKGIENLPANIQRAVAQTLKGLIPKSTRGRKPTKQTA